MRTIGKVFAWWVVVALAAGVACGAEPKAKGKAKAKAKAKTQAKGQANLLAIPQVSRDKVICFALYTVHNNVLKLTAQLYPLDEIDPRTARLEIQRGGAVARGGDHDRSIKPGWTAPVPR